MNPEIVSEYYQGGNWCIAFRLWRDHSTAVEPVVRIPMALWTQSTPEQQAQMRETGVAFATLMQPQLTADRPEAPDNSEEEDSSTTDKARG